MHRANLERLPPGQLIDLILALQARNEQLAARVAELETRLAQPAKTATNSSVPPAQGYKPKRKPPTNGPRKRGPKAGHPGTTWVPASPDMQVVAKVGQCPDCGQELGALPQEVVARRQLVDLPPIEPVVVEAQICQVTCPGCGHRAKAAFPAAFTAPQTFGPMIQALVTYLHEVHHVPYGRLQQVLAEVFGLKISAGSVVNLVRRTGSALQPTAEAIRREVIQSQVIASDETGARVDGANQWQWVFRTPQASYYVIVPSRSSQVIADGLGEARPQVWISDLWSAQQKAPAAQFQLCHAHQLRDLEYAKDCGDRVFAPAMQALLRRSEALARRREKLSPAAFATQRQMIDRQCDELLATDTAHPEGQKLQRRYRRHRDKLFVFLERPDVPYDNNGSERDLRNSVIHRKVTGGFRSPWAPQTFATLTTVIETAKKRGHGVFETLLGGIGRVLPASAMPALAHRPAP